MEEDSRTKEDEEEKEKEEGAYVQEGSGHIKAGMRALDAGDAVQAYNAFLKGVSILLQGGRTDRNPRRKKAVHAHLVQYLERLETLAAKVAAQDAATTSSTSTTSTIFKGNSASTGIGMTAQSDTASSSFAHRGEPHRPSATGLSLLSQRAPAVQRTRSLDPGMDTPAQRGLDTPQRPAAQQAPRKPQRTASFPSHRPLSSVSRVAGESVRRASTQRPALSDQAERSGGDGGHGTATVGIDENEDTKDNNADSAEDEVGSDSVKALLVRGERLKASVRGLLTQRTADLKDEAEKFRDEQQELQETVIEPMNTLFLPKDD